MDTKKQDKSAELRIELAFSATNIKNAIGIVAASEVVSLLDGIKDLIEDHMILIYLNKNSAIVGINAFLHNREELIRGETNRPLSRTVTHFITGHANRVIIVQALPGTEKPNIDSIKPRTLAKVAAKMRIFDIETQDIILMGTKRYFSYQENNEAWKILQEFLKPQLEQKDR